MANDGEFCIPALRLPADLDLDPDPGSGSDTITDAYPGDSPDLTRDLTGLSPPPRSAPNLSSLSKPPNSFHLLPTISNVGADPCASLAPAQADYFSFDPAEQGIHTRATDKLNADLFHAPGPDPGPNSDPDHLRKRADDERSRRRPSLLPPRNSLPPPPRIRSASSSAPNTARDLGSRALSAQSSRSILLSPGQSTAATAHTCTCSHPHRHSHRSKSESRIDFSLPLSPPLPVPVLADRPSSYMYAGSDASPGAATVIARERHRSAALSKLEANANDHTMTHDDMTCPHRPRLAASTSVRPSFLSIDTSHVHHLLRKDGHSSSSSSPLETSKTSRFKTPRTPKFVQHTINHLTLKDHNPLRTRFAQMAVPTHVHLPTPILPIIHLLLIIAHLVLSALIPYMLVKWFVQPLVLWVIAVVTIALECFYLVPGTVLEFIGLLRRRPIESAWLQSGVNLVIMILALAPHSLTVFLLFTANQVPECPSAILYKPPKVANFETHLRWSTCSVLPRVTMMGLVNLVVLLCEIIVTSFAVGLDYRIQRKEERRHSKILARESTADMQLDDKEVKKKRRRTWWRETPEERANNSVKIRRRRWTTGVGRLLWDIEGFVHRRKAKQREERAK
ncbi:hypothetical protein I316_00278 [Kwoniella heveanensis BCC8398]|uniref:Uncharacterized protein n=1 Tax=Kwoniella heveanensis BCC8398 TaxID=1296120 RepID=A0A1B9H453_9TREE|nr:hypothetical protein I316_00278 [Kwoniella heveanensis BCC8398]